MPNCPCNVQSVKIAVKGRISDDSKAGTLMLPCKLPQTRYIVEVYWKLVLLSTCKLTKQAESLVVQQIKLYTRAKGSLRLRRT